MKARFACLKPVGPDVYQVKAVIDRPIPRNGLSHIVVELPSNIEEGKIFQLYFRGGKWLDRSELFRLRTAFESLSVQWIGPLFDGSGYASASRNCVAALRLSGVDVSPKPVSFENSRSDYGAAGNIILDLLGKSTSYFINIMHLTPERFLGYREAGCYNIGSFCWETDVLPEEWVQACNQMDEIWVPCRWTAEVCVRSGVVVPVYVIPYPLPPEDPEKIEPYEVGGVDPSWYKFYSIFQWTERKNPEGLLRSYLTSFSRKDPVVLILKTYRRNYSSEEQEAVRGEIERIERDIGRKDLPRVVLIPQMLGHRELLGLHKFGDCFVLPHRSEGWGMPHMEACMMGNPVITTAYGGNLEFTLPDHSYLVEWDPVSVSGMPWIPWYRKSMVWADPKGEDLRLKMRFVFEHPDQARETGRRASQFVRNRFSALAVGNLMKRRLQEICGSLKTQGPRRLRSPKTLCIYYLLSQKVRQRWERTLQYQRKVFPGWESIPKIFVVDAPVLTDRSWRALLPGDVLSIEMFDGSYIRFSYAKNVGLQWGVDNGFEWILDCDADTAILSPPTVYPATGYGTMLCYFSRDGEELADIERKRLAGKLTFEASSRFLLRKDIAEKYRYCEQMSGYWGEDVDFHKNVLGRAGVRNDYTDAKGIHFWHERPSESESRGLEFFYRRCSEVAAK